MNLKFILLVPLLQALPVGAHDVNLEALAQAIGKPKLHDGRTNLIIEVSKERWSQVNTVRKFTGKARISLEEVNVKPWINREYVDDYLVILEAELKDKLGENLNEEHLFYGWLFGEKALQKANWNLTKLKNADLDLRWRLYSSTSQKQKMLGIPNALPTDGREPLPTRNKKKGEGG